jgi:hypothetical protein
MDRKPIARKRAKPMRDHKVDLRQQKHFRSFCAEPGCKFRGEPAEQGICFSRNTFTDGPDWSYIDRCEKYAVQVLAEMKSLWLPGKVNNKRGGMRGYVGHLESAYVTHWMQSILHLDEMVRLRRTVALLEHAARKRTRAERPR